MITETEAYDGFEDKASHANRGKTERNKIMFGPSGYWYVYLTYGMHWMLNIVTGERDYPAAVLIRSVEADEHGHKNRRSVFTRINGPGRVTKFLRVDKKFNGKRANRVTGLWIEERSGVKSLRLKVKSSPRVGVDFAGPVWSNKHYRFYLDGQVINRNSRTPKRR